MDRANPRKDRLEELLALAQAYRGWSNKQLAHALGRDPSNIIPSSGIPKLDLVIHLADALDWSVEDVVNDLCSESPGPKEPALAETEFDAEQRASYRAICEGRYEEAIEHAQQAYEVASTPDERAIACNRESGGWDGLGRFTNALNAIQRGLRENDASLDWRLMLRANLAVAYYTLGQHIEGKGVASDLIDWFSRNGCQSVVQQTANATSYYVRGHCYRCLIDGKDEAAANAAMAREDLQEAVRLHEELAVDYPDSAFGAIANTCRGGILEMQVFLEEIDAVDALDRILESIDDVSRSDSPTGAWLESRGWWCMFGCNIALRHVMDERVVHRHMAIFTNMADDIAEKLGNWALRERVLRMELARRKHLSEWAGTGIEWTMDQEDLRAVTGTMGRFPEFRPTAWQILRSARVIRE